MSEEFQAIVIARLGGEKGRVQVGSHEDGDVLPFRLSPLALSLMQITRRVRHMDTTKGSIVERAADLVSKISEDTLTVHPTESVMGHAWVEDRWVKTVRRGELGSDSEAVLFPITWAESPTEHYREFCSIDDMRVCRLEFYLAVQRVGKMVTQLEPVPLGAV